MISGASEGDREKLSRSRQKFGQEKPPLARASAANNRYESARRFDNFFLAACLQRGRVDQFASNSNCESSGREVFGSIPYIYTARRDQSGSPKTSPHGRDILGVSHR